MIKNVKYLSWFNLSASILTNLAGIVSWWFRFFQKVIGLCGYFGFVRLFGQLKYNKSILTFEFALYLSKWEIIIHCYNKKNIYMRILINLLEKGFGLNWFVLSPRNRRRWTRPRNERSASLHLSTFPRQVSSSRFRLPRCYRLFPIDLGKCEFHE